MRPVLVSAFLLLAVVILSVVIWITIGLFREPSASIQQVIATLVSGPAGIWIALQLASKVLPNPIKIFSASVLRLLPFLTSYWKKQIVKNELEGNLNTALWEFSQEGAGFINHEIKIEWLTPNSDARESFFHSGKAFIKLGFSENNDRNLVEAALMFCREGLLPNTRQYVPPALMRAIDLVFVDEILERRQATVSRAYLIHQVTPREVERLPEAGDPHLDSEFDQPVRTVH